MHFNYLALAIPLFVGLMLLEYFIARKRGRKIFRFARSITNINVGIAERLLDTFVTGAFYFFYDYLHRNFGIFDIQPSLLLWVALLVCTDFAWYWYHRLAHEINIFWAAHVVHHQSEDFNYTVSARITVFQAFVRTGFWAILPVIGFPAEMITAVLLVHGLYPFFVHTQLVGKLGVLEYIFVTPSHHRVHHASNPEYLDKNYGDVFIIWDKLFGTFRKEDAPVVYGLTKPLKTDSFLWQHFHYIVELLVAAKREKGWYNKLKIIFGRPDDLDPSIRDEMEKILSIKNNGESSGDQLNRYVLFQIISALVVLFGFILFEHYLNLPVQVLITILILLTLINCGAILEQRQWIFYLEYTRVFLVLGSLLLYYPNIALLSIVLGLLALGINYFSNLRKHYFSLVY